jgi:predicted small metal-binding protein
MDGPLMAGCACGWRVVGTADEIVAATMEHAVRVHNMTATREQVLAQAVPAPPDGDSAPTPAAPRASTPPASDG